MSDGIIPALDVHQTSVATTATIGSAITPTRACAIRITVKFSAPAQLRLDVYDVAAATTSTGYLNGADNLVADAWTNDAFEAHPGKTYTLKVVGATVTVDLLATEVHGSVI